MQAGELDSQITLYSATTAADSYGQVNKTWTSQGVFWAKVDEETGTESVRGDERVEDQPLTVTIRHGSGVQTDWKLYYNEQTYRITSVRMIGRRHWNELKAVRMGDSESGR